MHVLALALLSAVGAVFAGISAVRRDSARGRSGTRRGHGRRHFGLRAASGR